MSKILIEPIEGYGLSSKNRPKQLFSKVGIVGCGTVGQSIALMISQKDIEVAFLELCEERIEHALSEISAELDSMIEHWGMTPSEKRAIMARIHGYTDYKYFKDCDLVIEAIRSKTRERRIISRKEVFKNIEEAVSRECIIATNSTTIVITELSSELEYNHRCVSLHFLTNTPSAKMIEVVRGLYTSDDVYAKVVKFVYMLGKQAILVEESPGLISIRVFVAQLNEACAVLMEGVGSLEDIDKTMRIGFGQVLGPFEMADKIGLDKVSRWMHNLYNEFGDKKYIASPIIKKLVRARNMGRISGKGFYVYHENGKKEVNQKVA
ncbi:MAG: 3-hydroxyacyl-CoA dehydrogenase NAD-binding domain-containing protein [Salinivirgaceae bacterium]|jgi:3-hydroxybutyryl-CoA dehydrogenase|nr:3-hydroxyacyl-CoA dehydrogenase NAD-binding domain-containing protein [Salinivirgaceae bacterium]